MRAKKKICLVRAGSVCSRRTKDCLDVIRYAEANGFIVLSRDRAEEAEFGCLVTCGSTDSSIADSLSELNYVKLHIPEEKIVVLGCLSATLEGFGEKYKGRFAAPVNYLRDFDRIFLELGIVSALQVSYSELEGSAENFSDYIPYFSPEHWFLLTSEGCKGLCKYCRIKSAIGNLKSYPLESIIESLAKGIGKGYKLFWPSGDDLGAYGLDIGETFPSLLSRLIEAGVNLGVSIEIDCRTVIDPQYLIKYENNLLDIVSRNPANLISLGVGLQSAISRLLGLSNRHHRIEEIELVVSRIKKEKSDLFMPAHLIIGLPTETIKETRRTFGFIERSPIDLWICNKYSHLKGTKFYREYRELPGDPRKNYDVLRRLVYDSLFYYHEISPDGPLYIMKKANPKFFALPLKTGYPSIG